MTIVWVEGKCNILLPPIFLLLLKLHSVRFERGTGTGDVIDRETNVSETLGVFVAVVVDLALFIFRAVIVSQFEDAFPVTPRDASVWSSWRIERQEI